MDEPDPRIVNAAIAGDDQAFAALVRHCQADVWRFLRHLVGDQDLAADLTQDTLLRMHQSLPDYRFEGRFRSWVLRIARNVGIDALRSRERRSRRERALRTLRRHDGSANLDGRGSVTRLELDEAIRTLPIKHREVFVLVEMFGHSYGETSDILDLAEGTVKSRMFHARKQLIAWLADDKPESIAGTADDV